MFKQTSLPKTLRSKIKHKDKYNFKKNVLHVSELSYNCMYRVYEKRKHNNDDFGSLWNLFRGNIFDQYISPILGETQVRVSFRVPKTNFIIRGKIDAVNHEKNIIYEIKTVKSVKFIKNPYSYHIPQGLFYLSNFDPLATLKFVYLSMDGYKVFTFSGTQKDISDAMKEFEKKAKILGSALFLNKKPIPQKGSECNWCEHKKMHTCPLFEN